MSFEWGMNNARFFKAPGCGEGLEMGKTGVNVGLAASSLEPKMSLSMGSKWRNNSLNVSSFSL